MNHIYFWIEEQTRKFENSCLYSIQKIQRSLSMREVKSSSHVSIPPELHSIKNSIHSYRQLNRAAEDKMNELLFEQLLEIKKCLTQEEAKEKYIHFRATDWLFLRGDFAQIFRKAEMESLKIIHQKNN